MGLPTITAAGPGYVAPSAQPQRQRNSLLCCVAGAGAAWLFVGPKLLPIAIGAAVGYWLGLYVPVNP